ncbi:hypothetical protein [Georgenia sp.]
MAERVGDERAAWQESTHADALAFDRYSPLRQMFAQLAVPATAS